MRHRSNTALKRKSLLTAKVLRWYRKNGRQLPWRNEDDPYRVLVSEVMLQQTQVSRVLTKYPRFLKRFPSLRRLTNAKTSDVIKAWEGMGYNNRALRLQRLAVTVLDEHRGRIPGNIQELEALPGIGRYTAHALACFSFGQQVPVVDTNIKRVLTRLRSPQSRRPAPKEEDIWDLAESLLPRQHSHDWNQALMDLGATICTAAQPKCDRCPLVDLCPSAYRVSRRTRAAKKPEPGRDGIPNRIYRGRTIQALRELKTPGGMTRTALARKIKPNFTSVDRRWSESLLRRLQKDGLIRIRAGNRISLPE
ncbi:MAG: A/G-specific adenine glycosylase [Ignavibacteriales bacterium]|nr:A/G-specific adenine glycosylase [Ignavibacteriales bacterium]